MHGRLGVVSLLCCMIPGALFAQRVQGVLHDSTSNQPLSGAVVAVIDSAGTLTARTIANGAGAFTLSLGPTAARLHVLRIGYVPRDVQLPAGRRGSVSVSFSMLRIPPILAAMHVSDREMCPGSADRGAAFQLWDQARAGLLAGVVSRQTNPAQVTELVFTRHMARRDNLIVRQELRSRHLRTTRPFLAAATPRTFANEGYIDDDSTGGRTYYAPDDEVLLDPSFVATHCFHLQAPDTAHVGQNGLAFTPAPGRDTIADVAGVIWMDAATPALRTLDFHYTNIEPAAEDAGTGGHIVFRSMDNGASFIERWSLQYPILQTPSFVPTAQLAAPRDTHRRQTRTGLHVVELVESGGEVLGAAWPDGTHWQAPNTGLTGVVTQRGTSTPVPFALVTLAGTSDTVTADAQGMFVLVPVVAGRYTVVASDTTLARFTAPRTTSRVVDVWRDSVVHVNQNLQSLAEVIGGLCKGQHARADTSVIVGHIGTPGGSEMRDLEVRATWADVTRKSSAGLTLRTAEFRSTVDAKGQFLVCGAGRGKSVKLQVIRDGFAYDTTVITADAPFTPVDWNPVLRSPPPLW